MDNGLLGLHKCRGFVCYSMLISVDLLVAHGTTTPFSHIGVTQISNESIRCFDLSLDKKFVKLFPQQTQSNFAELHCNIVPDCSIVLDSKNKGGD